MQSTILDNPLVSFCILTYNQEKYIKDACMGAFGQDYPNLEIVISDDCSSDSTWDIVLELVSQYNGPHKLVLNKNEKNLGIRENCNKVLYELATGEIILLAGGDDVSLPERTRVTVDTMIKCPELSSVSFKSLQVDQELNPIHQSKWHEISAGYTTVLTLSDYIENDNLYIFSGESRALRRTVINAFPPLKYSRAEDIYLFLRSIYLGSIAYIRLPLVKYRQHDESVMGKSRNAATMNKRLSRVKRKRKWKNDIERFNNTTKKQLWTDLQYAVEHGYIIKDHEPYVANKLAKVEKWLMPQKDLSLCQKVLRKCWRIVKKISKT